VVSKLVDASSIELWRYYRKQPELFEQLPSAWQSSIEENYAAALRRHKQRQQRKVLPLSILATFAALTASKTKATTHTVTLTGTSADTTYASRTDANGNLVYGFAGNDTIHVESSGTEVYGVGITSASSTSSIINAPAGGLSIVATRDVAATGGVWGHAAGIFMSATSASPRSLTINGPVNINAVDNNSWVRTNGVYTFFGNGDAIWMGSSSNLTINGDTTLHAYSPSFGKVIYFSGNDSHLTINGNLTAESDSNGTNYAIDGESRSWLKVTGNVDLTASGLHPSDNVNGIWNAAVTAHTEIDGNLKLYAIARGSTVMGIRNNGIIDVYGKTDITALGNRTAFGVNAGHRVSKTFFHGDTTITVKGGPAVFGATVGAYNNGGNGGHGSMTFGGNLSIAATNGTFEGYSDVFGIDNLGYMSLATAGTATQIQAIGTRGTQSAYGIVNGALSLTAASNVAISVSEVKGATYGIFNQGSATFTGALSIAPAAGSTAASNYGVVTRTSGTTNINQALSNKVSIQGDVLTGSGSVLNLNLDTSSSSLDGLVLADTDGSVGASNLALSKGASWIITGAGTAATNFGTGSLNVGSGGVVDMAASWGAVAAGSVPSYSLRTLQVDSTASSGASVTLADGAQFTLLSDIRNAQADKVVFGSGIKSFTAQGTQGIRIAYDPVLDDTSWVNANAIQKGVTIAASSPIVIVDASAAASGTASFLGAAGLTSQWGTTHQNALVRYSYVPVVSLSADRKQILLTGIDILGNGSSTGSRSSGGTSTTPSGSGTGSTTTTGGGSTTTPPITPTTPTTPTTTSGTTPSVDTLAVTPSTGVLVAADAALALANAWQIDDQAVSRRSESARLGEVSGASGVWTDTDTGDFTGQSSDGRSYRQRRTNTSFGAERLSDFDGGHNAVGLVYTHTQSQASLQNGNADVRGDSIGVYDTWNSRHGAFADATVRVGQLRDSYSSADAFGSTSGRYRPRAASVSARAGWRYRDEGGGYVEPQVQAAYGSIGSSSYVASDQVHFDVSRNHTFLTRAGVLVGQTFAPVTSIMGDMYLRISAVHTIGSRPSLTAFLDGGSVPVTLPSRHGTAGEVVVGAHVALGGSWSVFAEAGQVSKGDTVAGGWRASAGVRASF
jgi:outer membrane autotransporter protein